MGRGRVVAGRSHQSSPLFDPYPDTTRLGLPVRTEKRPGVVVVSGGRPLEWQSILAVPDGGRVWAMVTAWIDFQVGSSQGGLATEPEEMTRSPRD